MGLFEYWCERCEKPYKMWKNVEPDPAPTCPHCGAKGRKLLGAALQFKGTGWTETGNSARAIAERSKSMVPKD